MGLREIRCVVMDWVDLSQDSDQPGGGGCCEHGNEPSGSIKCWEVLDNCTAGGLSRSQPHGVSLHVTNK
jgi:hypothetical protein